jgi:hypothetical protein
MSEFQVYEFQCMSRALTSEEVKEVNALSSHIDVTPRGAHLTYSFGSFKHDPEKVVAKYFDALLYQSSYGQKQLMLRFPKEIVQLKDLQQFIIDGSECTGFMAYKTFSWRSSFGH